MEKSIDTFTNSFCSVPKQKKKGLWQCLCNTLVLYAGARLFFAVSLYLGLKTRVRVKLSNSFENPCEVSQANSAINELAKTDATATLNCMANLTWMML